MKRMILFLGLIFLSACARSGGNLKKAACSAPLWEKRYVLDFEYGSVLLSERGAAEVRKIAYEAKYANADVCVVGYESYKGTASNAAREAFSRALNTAEVFLEVGVKPEKIFVDMEPRPSLPVLARPETAAQENRQAEIRIKK